MNDEADSGAEIPTTLMPEYPKTIIVREADDFLSGPEFSRIMAEARRLYDGSRDERTEKEKKRQDS